MNTQLLALPQKQLSLQHLGKEPFRPMAGLYKPYGKLGMWQGCMFWIAWMKSSTLHFLLLYIQFFYLIWYDLGPEWCFMFKLIAGDCRH